MVIETASAIYLFEFKLGGTSLQALEQIKEKKYFEKYLHRGKRIILAGAAFLLDDRNLADECIEELVAEFEGRDL